MIELWKTAISIQKLLTSRLALKSIEKTCFILRNSSYRKKMNHQKVKKSGVSSEVLRRNAETDLQRMYRERLEKEEVEEEEEYQ